MARFQCILEGKSYVTASLVPVAVFQIRKGYQAVIDNNETLHQVRALTKILLADFDKRYHPASTIGRLAYSNVAMVGFGSRYTTVHHYFFVAAFLDPCTKPLLKDIMTNQHLSQLKKDIVNLMVDEGERKKQIQIDNDNEERNTERRGSETESVNVPATAASHRVASMFQGLNTMSAEQDEDNEDEEEDMIRNICYAEFQRYKNVSIAFTILLVHSMMHWHGGRGMIQNTHYLPRLHMSILQYLQHWHHQRGYGVGLQEFSLSRGHHSNQKWHNKLCL
jgi:hypothetical protein